MWFHACFREIIIREIDLKVQFVKYASLENNQLYGMCNYIRSSLSVVVMDFSQNHETYPGYDSKECD